MTFADVLRLALGSVRAHRLRSALTVLGIVIGIASVVLLTSLGEGTRRAILSEFSQFGTNLLAVNSGKIETHGIAGAVGGTTRPLTLADAEALRTVPGIEKVAPVVFGTARVSSGERGRDSFVYGTSGDAPEVWSFGVRLGRFLPESELGRATPVAVLGPKLKTELFGAENALGRRIRVGSHRFLVIGVMAPVGQFAGLTLDDAVYIPVASAQQVFDHAHVMEIDATFTPGLPPETVVAGVKRVLKARHGGEEDFTVMTQGEMLESFGRVFAIVSAAVAGIGAISLLVGAIGILTMMWIAVGERTSEIGLLKALGATREDVRNLFLAEAALLSAAGGAAGIAVATTLGGLVRLALPAVPFTTPPAYAAAALAMAVAVGLVAGVVPARRAAGLDPVENLRAE
ncbi:MAG: ABC transporter permease [Thermoanaerobaculia bacterium]|nr:ABC transporter permease [Thermoanaerobaculia bacterium]